MANPPPTPPSLLPPAEVLARTGGRRRFIDSAARYGMAFGGISVIIAILLIFVYLLYVVLPMFAPASVQPAVSYPVAGAGGGETLHLALEEQNELGVRFTRSARVVFFRTEDGSVRDTHQLPLPAGVEVTSFAAADPTLATVALGLSDGRALVVRHRYDVTFPGDERVITPALEYPLGEAPVLVDPEGKPLARLAVQRGEEGVSLAAATADRRLVLTSYQQETSFLDDSVSYERTSVTLPTPSEEPTRVLIDKDQRELYVAGIGRISYFDITDPATPALVQELSVLQGDERIAALEFLAGGISLLIGTSAGKLSQWFPVRDDKGKYSLTHIRDFDAHAAAISAIAGEHNRKGFLAADVSGRLGIYHTTAHRTLLVEPLSGHAVSHVAVSPRANALLAEDTQGDIIFWRIHNEHPEISWSALWGKVWYESHEEPKYTWQSSSASNDFEPKFSLVPISFGTLKAAFYAMMFAIPLAIMGAIFTAHFMSPRMRRVVKPSIEIMEALPTVILGFLAGLWLAPIVEKHLPGIFSLLIILPLAILLAAYGWQRLPGAVRHLVPDGWEGALLIPVVLLIGGLAIAMSPVLEVWFFGGDMRVWLTSTLGVDFDQRNSIVVGIAMGFAVIPTIFSIAEDAIFAVPKHLVIGSLAMGATPWQTLVRVVLLTASPGIFSAVMIGFGRAVGETMIVLMATGNTPIMDMSIFQGMRTLAANIAVEMPESEVNSTHYRVLFLAGLVLFAFTFLVNTAAEIVRQRLRRRYSSL